MNWGRVALAELPLTLSSFESQSKTNRWLWISSKPWALNSKVVEVVLLKDSEVGAWWCQVVRLPITWAPLTWLLTILQTQAAFLGNPMLPSQVKTHPWWVMPRWPKMTSKNCKTTRESRRLLKFMSTRIKKCPRRLSMPYRRLNNFFSVMPQSSSLRMIWITWSTKA
jgi:hypothetical protein